MGTKIETRPRDLSQWLISGDTAVMGKNPNLDIPQHSTGKLTKQQNQELFTNMRGFIVQEEGGCALRRQLLFFYHSQTPGVFVMLQYLIKEKTQEVTPDKSQL